MQRIHRLPPESAQRIVEHGVKAVFSEHDVKIDEILLGAALVDGDAGESAFLAIEFISPLGDLPKPSFP